MLACNKEVIEGKPQDIEDALETTGFGTYHLFLILTCGLVLYAVNSESYSIGYVLPAAECDLELTVQDKSLLASIGFIGIMSSQFFWGFIADTTGRKNCLFYTLGLAFVFTVASTFSPYLWLFITFRYLNGFMISCASATIFAYLGEFCGPKYRSTAIMCSCIFIGLAITLIAVIAWLILPRDITLYISDMEFKSWRLFVFLCGLPSLFACMALFFFPESPKFLLNDGQEQKALEVLSSIYSLNKRKPKTDYPVKKLFVEEVNRKRKDFVREFFIEIFSLFSMEHLKKTVLVSVIQIGIFATSSGMLLWYPDILLNISKSPAGNTACSAMKLAFEEYSEGKVCSKEIHVSVFEQNVWIGVLYLVAYIAISSIIKFTGIKIILAVCLGISGACAMALVWVSEPLAINVLFIGLLVLCGTCVGVVNTAVVDLYPTHLRAMAVCVCMFGGRLGSVVSSSVLGYLLRWNCVITFFIYGSTLICCAGLGFLLPVKHN